MKNLERWHYPATVPEALELLSEGEGRVKLIGGGTALAESRSPDIEALVDYTRIEALRHVTVTADGRCTLGAAVTAQDLTVSDRLPPLVANVLGKAAGTISHRMHRNVITLGGNIVQLYAWSDLPVALVALDATYEVESVRTGSRRLAARALTDQHPAKVLAFHEMLTRVEIPAPSVRSAGTFIKFARTETDYALVTGAARVDLDGRGRIADCRLVLSGAFPRPVRLDDLEAEVRGERPGEALAMSVADKVKDRVQVVRDFRAGVSYRTELCAVAVKRGLLECFEQLSAERTKGAASEGGGGA